MLRRLDEDVAKGDVIVCDQTNNKAILGSCVGGKIEGRPGARKLHLRPIESLNQPLLIHRAKHGTVLEQSIAVNGPVMMRELSKAQMSELVRLAGAPPRVMEGKPPPSSFRPRTTEGD